MKFIVCEGGGDKDILGRKRGKGKRERSKLIGNGVRKCVYETDELKDAVKVPASSSHRNVI